MSGLASGEVWYVQPRTCSQFAATNKAKSQSPLPRPREGPERMDRWSSVLVMMMNKRPPHESRPGPGRSCTQLHCQLQVLLLGPYWWNIDLPVEGAEL